MTAAWSETLHHDPAADRRAWVQLGLALVGGAAVLGSIAGTAFGWVRSASCWCCNPEDEEPL